MPGNIYPSKTGIQLLCASRVFFCCCCTYLLKTYTRSLCSCDRSFCCYHQRKWKYRRWTYIVVVCIVFYLSSASYPIIRSTSWWRRGGDGDSFNDIFTLWYLSALYALPGTDRYCILSSRPGTWWFTNSCRYILHLFLYTRCGNMSCLIIIIIISRRSARWMTTYHGRFSVMVVPQAGIVGVLPSSLGWRPMVAFAHSSSSSMVFVWPDIDDDDDVIYAKKAGMRRRYLPAHHTCLTWTARCSDVMDRIVVFAFYILFHSFDWSWWCSSRNFYIHWYIVWSCQSGAGWFKRKC